MDSGVARFVSEGSREVAPRCVRLAREGIISLALDPLDQLYLTVHHMDRGYELQCYGLDGEQRWARPAGKKVRVDSEGRVWTPSAEGGLLQFHRSGGLQRTIAPSMEGADIREFISCRTGFAMITQTVVARIGAEGGLCWSRDLEQFLFPLDPALILHGELLLVITTDSHHNVQVLALHWVTGAEVWCYRSSGDSPLLSCTLHEDGLIVGFHGVEMSPGEFSPSPRSVLLDFDGNEQTSWHTSGLVVGRQAHWLCATRDGARWLGLDGTTGVGPQWPEIEPLELSYEGGRHMEPGQKRPAQCSHHPVMDDRGTVAVWAEGTLTLLMSDGSHEVVPVSREFDFPVRTCAQLMLSRGGTLIVPSHGHLLFFDGLLSAPAVSGWPCGGGTPGSNPAFESA